MPIVDDAIPTTARLFLIVGSVLAGLAVAAGAFGAHGLDGRVSPDRIATFETGAQYHMYHALALLVVAWLVSIGGGALAVAAGYAFLTGIVIFSGSLYLLVLTDTPWLGAITPLGGVAFIVGWGLLAWSAWSGGG
ncbi:DUF423 domain-containing protein [Salisaeta longa]|uniref:DUF423 domain-containing protein n=1 Tax=Salisaeta longa TaxID=503170 RepID=UPI0003B4FE60|nr:DUF423 domain-containing protein [Salisaeta longa]